MALQSGRFVVRSSSFCGSCDPSFDPIAGAVHGQYHVALGVSRQLIGSSLILRGEALYNRSVSSPQTYTPFYAGMPARPALRDESYVIDAGFEWDALPTKPWSPYLLTTVGLVFNRLGWNRDPNSHRIEEQEDSFGPLVGAGAGVRVSVGKRELFAEWRRHATANVYGSTFAPFSLGIRF
jgi:hypothetical protein